MKHRRTLIAGLVLMGLTAASHAEERLKLTELEPKETEFGLKEDPNNFFADRKAGAGHYWWGHFNPVGGMWPKGKKIVKSVDAVAPEKPDEYRSWQTDYFQVAKKKMAGVGLLAINFLSYHWTEYEIPSGSTKFTALVHATDDPGGYRWVNPDPKLHNYNFKVLIDGKVVHGEEKIKREGLIMGSGEVIAELDIEIPKDAKVIRFLLETDEGIDWNPNVEVVINDGTFIKP